MSSRLILEIMDREELSVGDKLAALRSMIPEGVELVAVSKFHPSSAIMEAYDAGQRVFGESRVQELLDKIPQLPADISWHFIGHLQTNKVKQLLGKVSLIESVDSIRLLKLIDEESKKIGVVSDVLLQLHVAQEETKFGFSLEEIRECIAGKEIEGLNHVRIRGLMAMASNTDDNDRIKNDFAAAASVFREIYPRMPEGFNVLSMGMSGDWPLAVEEGATSIRVGSAIFGNRIYSSH